MPYVSSVTRPDLRGNGPGVTRVPSPDVHHDDEVTEPLGRSYEDPIDWGRLGMFGLGIALGAILGSGTALLFAPQSGEEARAGIGRRARSMREDAHDAWEDLRDELEWAGRRGRRRLSRGATRSGWAAEDLLDRGRRRIGL